ncbi:MAG: hypothetical protein ACHP9Z_24690 [Streptosporangiales bacterium]
MTTTTPSTALVTIQPAFTDAQRLAFAGYLAGYRGLTREALRPGLAPVQQLVPDSFAAAVRGPPRRPRLTAMA